MEAPRGLGGVRGSSHGFSSGLWVSGGSRAGVGSGRSEENIAALPCVLTEWEISFWVSCAMESLCARRKKMHPRKNEEKCGEKMRKNVGKKMWKLGMCTRMMTLVYKQVLLLEQLQRLGTA